MGTADIKFSMTHPPDVMSGEEGAVAFARWAAEQFRAVVPGSGWVAEPDAEPVPTDRLVELRTLLFPGRPHPEYSWSIVAGTPPRDLYLSLGVGTKEGTESGANAALRFERREQVDAFESVYVSIAEDPRFDRVYMSVGADFHLRQDEVSALNERGWRLPTIGWRNRLRKPVGADEAPLELPAPAVVEDHGSHVEVTVGPDPFTVDPRDAVAVRDALLAAVFALR